MLIGDEPLDPAAVAAAARSGPLQVELSGGARERIAAGHAAAVAIAARRRVYGRTTGVGANRHVAVAGDVAEHGRRLLRSHAGGVGEPLDADVVRATMLIRLNQIARGGGGQRPEVADALAARLGADDLPRLRGLGGLGTGDLTVLAQLGLALGDALGEGDALPFMSSNAATFAVATLAWADLRELLDAGLAVGAESFAALHGNPEAYAEPVAAGRPLPGIVAVSAVLRGLTRDVAGEPARLQDPLGVRTLPQVGGALHEALAALHAVLAVELAAASENPLIAGDAVYHHGGFHAASLALALDTARLAAVQFGGLSLARLSLLMEPDLTGLEPFLSGGVPGSSGLMIAEYVGADAFARLRSLAVPTSTGGISISRGLEEHASFAWQGALQARDAVAHLRTLLALEHLAARRALDGTAPDDAEIAADVGAAEAELPRLARAARDAG
ncbi:MAG: aromatic amino acid ammonia-lyase [Solirubrobacteraceae bacterium]